MSSNLAAEMGIEMSPGTEFAAAAQEAFQYGGQIILGDRYVVYDGCSIFRNRIGVIVLLLRLLRLRLLLFCIFFSVSGLVWYTMLIVVSPSPYVPISVPILTRCSPLKLRNVMVTLKRAWRALSLWDK